MAKEYAPRYPELCAPLRLGGVTLRNRMCSAPMGFPDLTEDGLMTEGAIAFYERRAKGGAAVVTVSEACVDYENGKGHGRLINLQNPGVLACLTNAARAIKRHGALASIEINHAGMLSDFDALKSERKTDARPHYGPSDMVLPDGTEVKAMTREQITRAVELFEKGAAIIKRAGFDMIMLHAGHGWLIHQFLSPATNRRTDEYGGSFENRARLGLEIIDAIRRAVGPDFPVELRFSAMERAEGGIDLDHAIKWAKAVEGRVELLHVSAGGEPDFGVTHPSMFALPGCNVHFAREIKKHVSTPVATVGALGDPEQMEEIVKSGGADVVCMARALLADPELPAKVEQNRPEDILPCLRCFVCHAERMLTQTRVCSVNPEIGREYETRFVPPAPACKRVLIAGGGPGGMQCAVTAAQRGHSVTLCEATDSLGGNLRAEKNVPFKAAFGRYIDVMRRRMEALGVDVRLNTPVTPDFVCSFAPDALMVAVGSRAHIPDIPGIEGKNVVPAVELSLREGGIGGRVAIIGGGLVGCETAVYLASRGHEVTLVEMGARLAPDANPRHRPLLMAELEKRCVLRTGLKAAAVTEKGVECENGEVIPADTVVLAAGLEPRREVVDALRRTAPQVAIIGDCDKPGIIRSATFRAYHAALDL